MGGRPSCHPPAPLCLGGTRVLSQQCPTLPLSPRSRPLPSLASLLSEMVWHPWMSPRPSPFKVLITALIFLFPYFSSHPWECSPQWQGLYGLWYLVWCPTHSGIPASG